MSEQQPGDPEAFAEIAEPKPSAVETYKESLEVEHALKVRRRQLLLTLLIGGALGASLGEAYATGPETQPVAFGMAFVGGLLGAIAGSVVAAASWAQLAFQTKMYLPGMKPLGADMVRGNRWDRLLAWLAIWGSIGIACGAALGAGQSVELFNRFAGTQPPPWQWLGACGGLLLSVLLWTVIGSKRMLFSLLGVLAVATAAVCWMVGGR